MTDPRADEIEAWTAAVQRARAEYALHPITTCGGYRLGADGTPYPCPGTALNGRLCKRCKQGMSA